tara:strand:- start:828 stop:1217 length:390 start_codon:yes stop_codon:yes gene_type:complete
MIKAIAVVAMVLIPTLGLAHEMSPSLETEIALNNSVTKVYELTNKYPHASVYEVEVLTKDYKPAKDWEAEKTIYKMLPNSVKQIKLKIRADTNRKILVCTTLKEIGKQNEKAFISSRVCSRLIILSSGK